MESQQLMKIINNLPQSGAFLEQGLALIFILGPDCRTTRLKKIGKDEEDVKVYTRPKE